MIMYHLGPQLGVWIMQVSTFSSVLINRSRCIKLGSTLSRARYLECLTIDLWSHVLSSCVRVYEEHTRVSNTPEIRRFSDAWTAAVL